MDDVLPFDGVSEHPTHEAVKPKRDYQKYIKGIAIMLVCAVVLLFVYKHFARKQETISTVSPPSPHREGYLEKFGQLKEIKIGNLLNSKDYNKTTSILNGMDCYERMLSNPSAPITNTMLYRMAVAIAAINEQQTQSAPAPTPTVSFADVIRTKAAEKNSSLFGNDIPLRPRRKEPKPEPEPEQEPTKQKTEVAKSPPLELQRQQDDSDSDDQNTKQEPSFVCISLIGVSPLSDANIEEVDD